MQDGAWVVAWQGGSEVDAEIVAGRLRAEGIDAMVTGSHTPYRTATFPLGGTWAIRVRQAQLAEAQAILAGAGEGPNLPREEPGLLSRDQRATLVAAGLALGGLAVALALYALVEAMR